MNARPTLLIAALLAAPLIACGGPGDLPRFNEATIETVSGYVTEVDPFVRLEGNTRNGVRATIEDEDGERTDVYLGPATYLDRHGIRVQRGDELDVTGSKVRYEGDDVIIATAIDVELGRLAIRTADGRPAWRGRNRTR